MKKIFLLFGGLFFLCLPFFFLLKTSSISPVPSTNTIFPSYPEDEVIPTNSTSIIFISIDKPFYSLGEDVNITLTNQTEKTIYLHNPSYIIEQKQEEGWKEIRQISCPCAALCKRLPYISLSSFDTETIVWKQKEEYCLDEKNQTEERYSAQVEPGTYRVKTFLIPDAKDITNKIPFYSSNFLIR